MNKFNFISFSNCIGDSRPFGWTRLVDELLETISSIVEDYSLPTVNILQIKQKFTELRVYYRFSEHSALTDYQKQGVQEINELIDFYQWLSRRTCTLTGLPGKQVVIKGFYTVLHKSLFKENKRNEQCYTDKGRALNQQLRELW